MKPKRLPRLWCALQGLLPLEGARKLPAASAGLDTKFAEDVLEPVGAAAERTVRCGVGRVILNGPPQDMRSC